MLQPFNHLLKATSFLDSGLYESLVLFFGLVKDDLVCLSHAHLIVLDSLLNSKEFMILPLAPLHIGGYFLLLLKLLCRLRYACQLLAHKGLSLKLEGIGPPSEDGDLLMTASVLEVHLFVKETLYYII